MLLPESLEIIIGHARYKMRPLRLDRTERCDVEAAVDPVHVVTAQDLLLGIFGKGQDTLVAAACDADDPFILDIEVQGLFTAYPNHNRQIKCHKRTAVVELVDMTRLALDQFAPVRKGIVRIGRGKILSL